MSLLEIFAILFTIACVGLAVYRNIWTYPIGMVGTVLYFFVFLKANLVASAALQVFFLAVQVYGWWYWLYGDKGQAPLISRFGTYKTVISVAAIAVVSFIAGTALSTYTGAQMAGLDSILFGVSVLAQLGLDRKKIENWAVWIGIDIVSVYVYYTAGLTGTAILYLGLLVIASVGLYQWIRAYREQTARMLMYSGSLL